MKITLARTLMGLVLGQAPSVMPILVSLELTAYFANIVLTANIGDRLEFPRSSSPVLPSIPSNVHNDGLVDLSNTNILEYPSMNSMEGPTLAELSDAGSEAQWGHPQAQPLVPEVSEPREQFSPPYEPVASCKCVLAALDLLEKLQTNDHRSSSNPIDHTLKLSKYALNQCSELATCENCMNTSRFTMLLINLCQIVVANLDKALSGFEPPVNTENEDQKETSTTATIDTPEDSRTKDSSVFLKSYEIDNLEQLYVFGTLVRLQISQWKTILARLKSALSHLGLETQSAILHEIDVRLCTQHDVCTTLILGVGKSE